ncbi:TPM domain-containing protein [Hymenobacter artigasi]|uniref:Membrane protein YgcG n=1 Tax=Hymenobacter artigasi TaxID=2719616 RepID=A0ABX1HC30_9BACT|nr:TPM domain-containing protein [Hymenobacter artigasi]NKI87717.1 putative membrane protein YgcG [Hymenobacter artigasi]
MSRFLILAFLFVSAGLAQPALAQTDGLPPRPTPFRFVNDEAQLMQPADAKKLESGLRRYADNTGTQVVVVTVPTLGGRDVADYGRAIGTAWGVGQRDKNNGIVVLLSGKEHKVTIQPGSGLQSVITPEVTSRIINEMTPGFKQGNYFAGLRTGLNTLMVTANPSSAPKKDQSAATSGAAGSSMATDNSSTNLSQDNQYPTTTTEPLNPVPAAEPVSSGPGMGTLLIGALIIGGILWFVVRMFKGRSAAASNPNTTPDFLPNRAGGPTGGGYSQAPGSGNAPNQSSGPGIGGMLATGAAAAAGAYLGNRMASGHDTSGQNLSNYDNNNSNSNLGAAAAGAAGTGAASDYFSGRDGGTADNSAPDYFSDANTAPDNSNDFFSSDDNNSSYDDTSSNDTGGGGFDSGNDNSGSW